MPHIGARESYTAFRDILLPLVTPGSHQIPAEIDDSLADFTLRAAQSTHIADIEQLRSSEMPHTRARESYTAVRDLLLPLVTPGSRSVPAVFMTP